jgi:ABC-2 type transport system permease protein
MIRPAIDAARPIGRYRSVMPGSLLMRELLVTLARPRALLLKLAIPLLLTLPLLAGHAPTFWSGMLLTVLVAMTGAVGAAVSAARARESGLLARLAVTPRSPGLSMLNWVAGSTLVDAIQLAPTLLAIFVLAPVTAPAALSLVVIEVAVLFMANVLGSVVSAAGGGTGEVLIDVAVLLAPLLFLGGLFTGVPRDGWRWVAAQLDPFSYLDSAFIRALGGVAAFDERTGLVAACITVLVAALAIVALGRVVLRRR